VILGGEYRSATGQGCAHSASRASESSSQNTGLLATLTKDSWDQIAATIS